MIRLNHFAFLAVLFAATSAILAPAHATDFTWTNGNATGIWNDAGNWFVPGIPFGSGDTVTFDSTPTPPGSFVVDLNGDRAVSSASFADSDAYTLNNNTFNLISGDITTSGTADHTINSNLAFVADADWNIGGGSGLIINGVVSGGFPITKTGTGTLTLNGANTFTAGMTIQDGTLSLGNSSAAGIRN